MQVQFGLISRSVCKNEVVLKPAFVSAQVDSNYPNIPCQSPPKEANKHKSEAIKLELFEVHFRAYGENVSLQTVYLFQIQIEIHRL